MLCASPPADIVIDSAGDLAGLDLVTLLAAAPD
jgi:hypothetical protein